MRLYDHEVKEFWLHHPGAKVKLMGQSTVLLWQPSVFETEGAPDASGAIGTLRSVAEPLYMVPLYLLAIAGLLRSCRGASSCSRSLFVGYETFAAWVFAGTTRYRVAWDFVLALLAAAALARVPFRSLGSRRRCGGR